MIFTRRKNTRVPETGPVYLTQKGLESLKERLVKLKSSLPGLADEVQRAAAYGDRSENAEYKEAKSILRKTEGQILGIEDRLKRVELIRPDKETKDIVQLGSTVTLVREDGSTKKFQILGRSETNPEDGFISNESPLGRAVLGKKVGDKFKFVLPSGATIEYGIMKTE